MSRYISLSIVFVGLLLAFSCERVDFPYDYNENSNTGNETDDGDKEDNNNKDEEMTSSSFPKSASIWNNHVVATSNIIDDNHCEIMLLSLKSWLDIYSAYHSTKSEEAMTHAKNYVENELDGWSIPTKNEAEILISIYSTSENLEQLNSKIVELNGTRFIDEDQGGNYARYLCDDAKTSFALTSPVKFKEAGKTTRYRLKLVKRITLTKQK